MINKLAILTLLPLLICIVVGKANAEQVAQHVPAALNDSRYSLQNRIKFPRLEGDFHETVICDVSLSRGGRFRSNYCYSNNNDTSLTFARVVHNAAKGAKITPARINGIGHWAFYQYSVEFIQQGDDRRFIVKSYQGYNKVVSPKGYSAPQRILRRKWSSIPGCPLKMYVGIKVKVDENGKPSNARIFSGQPNKICAASIVEWTTRQSYIPAMADETSLPSVHIEYLLGPVDWRASQVR